MAGTVSLPQRDDYLVTTKEIQGWELLFEFEDYIIIPVGTLLIATSSRRGAIDVNCEARVAFDDRPFPITTKVSDETARQLSGMEVLALSAREERECPAP